MALLGRGGDKSAPSFSTGGRAEMVPPLQTRRHLHLSILSEHITRPEVERGHVEGTAQDVPRASAHCGEEHREGLRARPSAAVH